MGRKIDRWWWHTVQEKPSQFPNVSLRPYTVTPSDANILHSYANESASTNRIFKTCLADTTQSWIFAKTHISPHPVYRVELWKNDVNYTALTMTQWLEVGFPASVHDLPAILAQKNKKRRKSLKTKDLKLSSADLAFRPPDLYLSFDMVSRCELKQWRNNLHVFFYITHCFFGE